MPRTAALLLLATALLPLSAAGQAYDPESRLAEMGITLPVPDGPSRSAFDRTVQTGDLASVSFRPGGSRGICT